MFFVALFSILVAHADHCSKSNEWRPYWNGFFSRKDGKISWPEARSSQQCQDICQSRTGCQFWKWSTISPHTCYMSDCAPPVNPTHAKWFGVDPGYHYITGPRDCSKGSPPTCEAKYCIEYGYDYLERNVAHVHGVQDPMQCRNKCDDHDECKFWTWSQYSKTCYLKHSKEGRRKVTSNKWNDKGSFYSGMRSEDCAGYQCDTIKIENVLLVKGGTEVKKSASSVHEWKIDNCGNAIGSEESMGHEDKLTIGHSRSRTYSQSWSNTFGVSAGVKVTAKMTADFVIPTPPAKGKAELGVEVSAGVTKEWTETTSQSDYQNNYEEEHSVWTSATKYEVPGRHRTDLIVSATKHEWNIKWKGEAVCYRKDQELARSVVFGSYQDTTFSEYNVERNDVPCLGGEFFCVPRSDIKKLKVPIFPETTPRVPDDVLDKPRKLACDPSKGGVNCMDTPMHCRDGGIKQTTWAYSKYFKETCKADDLECTCSFKTPVTRDGQTQNFKTAQLDQNPNEPQCVYKGDSSILTMAFGTSSDRAPSTDGCPPLSTDGRCGPLFGDRTCSTKHGPWWAVYCNTENGWCGDSDAHKHAQTGTAYDEGSIPTGCEGRVSETIIHKSMDDPWSPVDSLVPFDLSPSAGGASGLEDLQGPIHATVQPLQPPAMVQPVLPASDPFESSVEEAESEEEEDSIVHAVAPDELEPVSVTEEEEADGSVGDGSATDATEQSRPKSNKSKKHRKPKRALKALSWQLKEISDELKELSRELE